MCYSSVFASFALDVGFRCLHICIYLFMCLSDLHRAAMCCYVLICAAVCCYVLLSTPWLGQVWPPLQLTQRPAWAHPREEASATRSSAYPLATFCNIWHILAPFSKTFEDSNGLDRTGTNGSPKCAKQVWQCLPGNTGSASLFTSEAKS